MADLVDVGGRLELEGLREFVSGMRKAGRATKKVAKQLSKFERFQGAVGKTLKGIGTGLSKGAGLIKSTAKSLGVLTAATVGLGGAAINAFGKFDGAIGRIGTLLPANADAMEDFGDRVLDASRKFGQSAEITADAFFQAISASVPTDKIDDFIQVVGEAATGASTDMATVVDGLTNTINAFGLKTEDARDIANAFFVANKLGKTTFDELSRSIGNVAPLAAGLGVSYQDLLGTSVALTKAGVTQAKTFTQLQGALTNISRVSDKARKEATRLFGSVKAGKENFSAAALKAKGFTRFMQDLSKVLSGPKGTGESIGKLFESVEAMALVSRLASKGGMADLGNAMKEVGEGADLTGQNFANMSDRIDFKMKQVKAGLGSVFIEIGRGLVGGLGIGDIKDIPAAMASAAKTAGAAAKGFAQAFSAAFAPLQTAGEFDFVGLATSLGKAAGTLTTLFIKAMDLLVNSGLLDTVTKTVDFLISQFAPEIALAGELTVKEVEAIQTQVMEEGRGGLSEDEIALLGTGGSQNFQAVVEKRVLDAEIEKRGTLPLEEIINKLGEALRGGPAEVAVAQGIAGGVAVTPAVGAAKKPDVVNVQNNLTVTVPGQGTFVKRDDATLRGAGDATKKSAQQLTHQLTGGGAVEFGDEVSVARETRGN